MLAGPYAQYNDYDRTLRDHLAQDRTVLANERTLLSHIRTSLNFFILGVTLIKFIGSAPFELIGWMSLLVGIALLIRGIAQYQRVKSYFQKSIEKARKNFWGLSVISDTFQSFIR